MKTAPWILMALIISPMQVAVAKARQADSPATGQQDDSLAAAARKAREQKKNDGKPAKVWDNDHMPTGTINVIGQAPTTEDASATAGAAATGPAADQSKTAPAAPGNPAAVSKEKRANLQAGLESAQQEVESLKSDLDIQQRKYALDQQSYYGKPDYASDKAGAAALDDEKQQIDGKQQELADAQKRVDDLQGQLAAAGPPDSK
jgi:hypothetical protein